MTNRKTVNITYTGEICDEIYYVFLDEINEAIKRNWDVKFYFSTFGGSMGLMENMVQIINEFPNNIEIICNEFLLSAGLMFVANVKRPIIIGNSCMGLVHAPSIMLESRGTKKKTGFDSFMQQHDEMFLREYLQNIKPILTEDEIKDVEAGEDVCIGAERIRELIKIQQSKGE